MSAVTPHRRPTASSRLRENRPQQGPSNSNTTTNGNAAAARARKKSRSPDSRGEAANVASRGGIFTFARKRRPGGTNATPAQSGPSNGSNLSGNSNNSRPHSMNLVDEFGVERGRRGKSNNHNGRPVSQASDADTHPAQDAQNPRKHGKGRKKDKQKEREGLRSRSKSKDNRDSLILSAAESTLVPGEEMDVGVENKPSGSVNPSDYAKLKDEIEMMRKHLASAKKVIQKQSKAMEDLKQDIADAQKSHSEERQNSARLQAESQKLNEMVTAVEANLACQICMDMLFKPYGLSPCGHVLCLNCLQEWFRRAPPGDEDMDDEDDDPESVLYRRKSCPVCRTHVYHRPIPVFVIKSIASAFDKAKPGSPRQPSPPHEGDPWSGIFPEAISPYDDFDDEDDYDGDSMGDEDDEGSDGHWPFADYGSDSDEDYYYGEYVHPHWAPPTVHIDPEDYPFDEVTDDVLAMLRRGATPQMIMLFQMEYTHDGGLVASMDGNKIYLGWNISLQAEDVTGEEFMDWIEADIVNHPERWDKEDEEDEGDHWSAWRLIQEDADGEFADTDSEFWAEELAELD